MSQETIWRSLAARIGKVLDLFSDDGNVSGLCLANDFEPYTKE